MAIITVSNIGGNFSDTATWVGGEIPVYPDTIAFTSTSGDLTIDNQYTLAGIDFTNYTGIFRMLSGATKLSIIDDGAGTAGFINMGSGGYTLIDDGTDFGFSVNGAPPVILTNNVGKVNPFPIGLPDSGTVIINGNWKQEGFLIDGGFGVYTFINNGIFTLIGTHNYPLMSFSMGCNALGGVYFNGDITFGGATFDGGDIKLIGGTFNCPSISFYNSIDNIKIDFNNYTFEYLELMGNINNSFQLDSTLLANDANIFDANLTGNFGFNANKLTGSGEIIFKSTIEYFVNNQINMRDYIIMSSVAGVKAKLTLGQNIDQLLVLNVTATDIDSSNGVRVNNFYGTATNCDNWRIWNDNTLPQVPSTF